jgi:hypothetical protein
MATELEEAVDAALEREFPAKQRKRRARLEALATVLLSTATLASAWSAYQATRWSGVQAIGLNRATNLRSESIRASNRALQQAQVDITSFVAWALSLGQSNERAAKFLEQRFRPEFRPAFEAWKAAGAPGEIAPGTPFTRPEYQLAARAEAESLVHEAEQRFAVAQHANQASDNYIFAVVLFTSVMFFAGIESKAEVAAMRLTMLALAVGVLVVAFIFLAQMPVDVGFHSP